MCVCVHARCEVQGCASRDREGVMMCKDGSVMVGSDLESGGGG